MSADGGLMQRSFSRQASGHRSGYTRSSLFIGRSLCDPEIRIVLQWRLSKLNTRCLDGQIGVAGRGALLYMVSVEVVCCNVLGKAIRRPAARAMQDQMPGADKRGHVILNRAAIRASCLGNFTDRDTSAFAAKLQNLNGEFRQISQENAFALNFLFQPCLLLHECAEEVCQPGQPIGRRCTDRRLRLP